MIKTAKSYLAVLSTACLIACQQSQTTSSGSDSDSVSGIQNESPSEENICFRKVSGLQNKDTLSISLKIEGNKVSGKMRNAIYEKDARTGEIEGELMGNSISAVWKFNQEGTTDTMKVEFQFGKDEIQQRPFMFNEKTGREQTNTASADWIKIPKVECSDDAHHEANVTATGTIGTIMQGKDGYMATLKSEDGNEYLITMSIIRMEKQYVAYKAGDKVTVSGDTIHVNNKVNILVKRSGKAK